MKLAFCSLAFRDADIAQVIQSAAQLDFDEIEIFGKHVEAKSDEELDAIRETAATAGIGISGVSPYFWLTQNEELLAESHKIARRAVHVARQIGARMIRTFTDAGPTGVGSDVATGEHWQTAVEALQQITSMAPEIIFAVETHHKTLADTPATCERLLQEVNRPNLKLIYQPFSEGNITEDFLRLETHVRHIHLNPVVGPQKGRLADCGIDYAALLRLLSRRGFKHSCALELCCGQDTSWDHVREELDWCRAQMIK